VQLHELLGQRQPEPRALLLPSILTADLAELLEDGRLILGRDPDPRVADADGDDAIGKRGRSMLRLSASTPSVSFLMARDRGRCCMPRPPSLGR
jgi:hypothetical protein